MRKRGIHGHSLSSCGVPTDDVRNHPVARRETNLFRVSMGLGHSDPSLLGLVCGGGWVEGSIVCHCHAGSERKPLLCSLCVVCLCVRGRELCAVQSALCICSQLPFSRDEYTCTYTWSCSAVVTLCLLSPVVLVSPCREQA